MSKKKIAVDKDRIINEIINAAEDYYRERSQGSVKKDNRETFILSKIPYTISVLEQWKK